MADDEPDLLKWFNEEVGEDLGSEFFRIAWQVYEDEVGQLFRWLQDIQPDAVTVQRQPRIELYSGDYVIPDFLVTIRWPHETSTQIFECQLRNRSSSELLHKIEYIKDRSAFNRFYFVPGLSISKATQQAFERAGITVLHWRQFALYIARLGMALQVLSGARPLPEAIMSRSLNKNLPERLLTAIVEMADEEPPVARLAPDARDRRDEMEELRVVVDSLYN